ncbi:MAG: methionyl-tRNA formyltransferase [Anaerolineaceae bacterium]|nr:methionyl-tRNA formyltransferase [Anaerolineaceae bacterium]
MADVVFMGTPEFALPALRALLARHRVTGVVTMPDRPAGRGLEPRISPVKALALEHDLPLLQPRSLRREEAIATLGAWPADVYVVAAFGLILPQSVLDLPPWGSLNIHASLLPRWRGAAPIQAAIRAGDARSGVSLMLMDVGLDSGPVLAQQALPLAPDETTQGLHDRLATLGAELLIENLPDWLGGRLEPQPQDESRVTLAPQLRKEDGWIDWSQPALDIERQIRAFTPWPGSHTAWNSRQLKILQAEVVPGSAAPGRVVSLPEDLGIGTGAGLLRPRRLQLAGRRAQASADFLRGRPAFLNATLDRPDQ